MKIIVTGPESSGKTSLCSSLARHFDLPLVEEFSREYLNSIDRKYGSNDLEVMARGQLEVEQKALTNSEHIICDTSTEVYKIWYEYRFGSVQEELSNLISFKKEDFYLLLVPNIPWIPDPLRENPDDREHLYELYLTLLKTNNLNYEIIDKQDSARKQQAVEYVAKQLAGN